MSEHEQHTTDRAVAVVEQTGMVNAPATVDDLLAQVHVIQDAMSRAMRVDEHYGVIPGTKGKPSLLKAGAEKLSLLFRLRPQYHVTRYDLAGGHREYEVRADLINVNGEVVGQGLGLCSSLESRYRYRTASRRCPACGAEAIIKGKEEWGGGFICHKKQGGCGRKFLDADPAITGQQTGKAENPDIADVLNTILKMAKKRALVDGILTVTACSDVFTQDLEDLPQTAAQFAPEAPPPDDAPPPRGEAPVKADPNMSPEQVARYVAAVNKIADANFDVIGGVLKEMGTTIDDVKTILDKRQAAVMIRDLEARCEAALEREPLAEEVQP